MTKPGYVDAGRHPAEQARIRDAGKLTERLAAGNLPLNELTPARDTFVELLWQDTPSAEKAGRAGIAALYERIVDPSDEGQLIGDLVASGRRGVRTFDQVVQNRSPRSLNPTELNMLRESLDKAPTERLALVARWLNEQADKQRPSKDGAPDFGPREIAEPPKQRGDQFREPPTQDGGPAPDPEAKAEAILRDHRIPDQDRLEYARRVGTPALGPLMRMLNSDDIEDRDFANHAMHLLAASPSSAKKVFDAAHKLELEVPSLRSTMEHIRGHAQHTLTGREQPTRLPPGVRDAQLHDGILSRALSMCDAPSILRAAAGWETVAIPLVLRQLAALRASV